MLTHDEVQAALSARFDGEETGIPDDVVDSHLAHCAQCKQYEQQLAQLSMVLQPARQLAPAVDLAEEIIAGVEPEWRRVSRTRQASMAAAQVVLSVLALVCAVWAVTLVMASGQFTSVAEQGIQLNPDSNQAEAQLFIEAAAWRFGAAAGLGFVVWRPRYAAGLLPLVATAFFFLFGFAMRDVVLDQITQSQLYSLAALGLSAAALAWVWLADRGNEAREFWRGLSAQPA